MSETDLTAVAVPLPDMPAGRYALYGDIVHEYGIGETAATEISLPDIAGHPLSGDDAAGGDAGSLRSGGLGGTPAEVVDKLGRLAELGAERVYLQVMDLADLDHLGLVAAEVAPHV
jgi:hypothetical protein